MAINIVSPKDSMLDPANMGGLDGGPGRGFGIDGGMGPGGGDGVERPTLPPPPTRVTVSAQPAAGVVDTQEPERTELHPVRVTDHSGDTSNWTAEQWIDAIKRDPAKYLNKFAEALATNKLSENAKSGKDGILMIAQLEMQAHTEAVQFRSNLTAAFHQANMGTIGNIRA